MPSEASSPLLALVTIVLPSLSTLVLFSVFVTSEVVVIYPFFAMSPAFALVSEVAPNGKSLAPSLPMRITTNFAAMTNTKTKLISAKQAANFAATFKTFSVSALWKMPFASA